MAEDEREQGKRLGGFEVGSPYEQVGPELGRLHEARHSRTGDPALLLRPSGRMDWKLQAGWRLSLSTHRRPPFVRLRVRRAPRSGRGTKLTDFFVLLTSALRHVEDEPRLDAHLTSGRRDGPWRRRRGPGLGWALTTGTLCLGALGVGLGWRGGGGQGTGPEEARLVEARCPQAPPIAFPMPRTPLPEQATIPCNTRRDEIGINGGCWVLLKRKPPCIEETTAEYQGECYYPVYKGQEPKPRPSVQP